MVTSQRPSVVGVFANRRQAERAIEELHRAGFRGDQIGFAMRGEENARSRPEERMDTARDIAGGVSTGGLIGGILGAIATGLIPGIGPVIAGGLLAGIVGGATVGAGAGGLVGALMVAGTSEEEARYYEREFEAGRAIVQVKAGGRWTKALSILRRHGARQAERQEPAETEMSSWVPPDPYPTGDIRGAMGHQHRYVGDYCAECGEPQSPPP